MTGTDDRTARVALARLVEPGLWSLHRAVAEHGAATVVAALQAHRRLPGLSPTLLAGAAARSAGYDVATDLDRLRLSGIRVVVPGDAEWPEQLSWERPGADAGLQAPPLALFLRGPASLSELMRRSVAVVGARAATAYGSHVAQELGLGLADRGFTVLSGAAYGIDGAAHRGALASEHGRTTAVLACGVDVAYPRGHDRLLARIAERGLLVSEHLPGVAPTRGRFLVRNRLIAALTGGTVVVEAALRSGSLSTAHRALELGRITMAVPGPVTSALSGGCHELVRGQSCTLVTCAADVHELLAPAGEGLLAERRGPQRIHDDLPEQVRRVLEAVPVRGGVGAAELARDAAVSVQTVLQVLPPLELNGLVQRAGGGWVLTALGAGRPRPQS